MAALRLRDGLYGLILILRMASHAHLGVPITLPTRASGAGAFKPEANIRSQAKSGNANAALTGAEGVRVEGTVMQQEAEHGKKDV